MSGKVPKRVLTERTGGSREGSRIVNGVKMNEGAATLGLVGSVGHRNTAWTWRGSDRKAAGSRRSMPPSAWHQAATTVRAEAQLQTTLTCGRCR